MPRTTATGCSTDAGAQAAQKPDAATLAAAVDQLVDEQRIACLWFLRPDYYPATDG